MFKCRSVFRIHGDRATELTGPGVTAHFAEKNIKVTCTPGYESNNNGRAERGIGIVKAIARTMLQSMPQSDNGQLWGAAVMHAAYCSRAKAMGKPSPRFMKPVMIAIRKALKNRRSGR